MNDERPEHRRAEADRAAVERGDVDEHISAIGIEMSTVVIVNTFAIRGSMPAMNWWCAHTKNDSTPVAIVV